MMIDFELKLPPEQKDESGFTPSENRVIEKQFTKPSPPKGTWKRFVKANEEADKVIAAKAAKAAEAAKEKKHLKELILFGLEHSHEPVIKNPVMRAALEPKPKKSVNYLSNNYSFAENFKKQSKNINDYKPTTTTKKPFKPFKTVPKIKPGEPVKIDFNLDPMPMHTAGLWSNIKNSSIYKLLDNPKVMGVELGHEGIMEAYNLLQKTGLLKKGGRVK